MSKKPRNFAQEYARRIASAESRGLSRSAARGHPRSGENGARAPPRPIPDDRLQVALRILRDEGSLTKAAKGARIAPERLRHLASQAGLIQKSGRNWQISPDVKRNIKIISNGSTFWITAKNKEEASLAGKYRAAVQNFIRTNEVAHLVPFRGVVVVDENGLEHELETDPNTLYRLLLSGDHAAEHIYRIQM